MSWRRVAATARVRFAGAVRQRRAKVHLALSDLFEEVRYPQHGGEHHNDKYRGTHIRVLPRNQQLESGHSPPPLPWDATAVPGTPISLSVRSGNSPPVRCRPFGNALEEQIRPGGST